MAPGSQPSEKPTKKFESLSDFPSQRSYSPVLPQSSKKHSEPRTSESYHDLTSSMSGSEEHELGEVISLSGSDNDEETGLTSEERRKYLRRKRRKHQLDSRIADEPTHGSLSNDAAKLADRQVLRSLVINTLLIVSWYTFSLSISIYNKWMFSKDHLNFHYPLFTTSLHMVVQFTLSALCLIFIPSLRPRPNPPLHPNDPVKPLITPQFYLTRLALCGVTTSLDIGLGNTSLRYITLTFYTMCKSSVLIWVLLFAFLFRLERPSWKLIAIILAMTLGVLMMVFGESAFHALGFALAISASFFSGFRWALTQILLLRHPATSNPFASIFLLSPIMFVSLFTLALFAESFSSVVASLAAMTSEYSLLYVIGLLLFPGLLAFCMIASEYTLLQRTNVVTLSICGIFKEVVTIIAAEVVFHDYMTLVNFAGLVVTIVSIACYNYLKVTRMREDARRAQLAGGKREGDVALGVALDGTAEGRRGGGEDRIISPGSSGSESSAASLRATRSRKGAGPAGGGGKGSRSVSPAVYSGNGESQIEESAILVER